LVEEGFGGGGHGLHWGLGDAGPPPLNRA
jgi:hypothetical protein